MGREFELKFDANASSFAILKARYQNLQPIRMQTTYYDTPDGKLGERFWTFRRRLENDKSVITLKTPAAGHGRNEWEVSCDDLLVGMELLIRQGAPAELLTFGLGDGFEESCGARFTRLAGLIELNGATVELALDEGVLLGGGKELPFMEIEVELKTGSEAAAVAFARKLAGELNLKPQPKSKVARARELAKK